ncbi:MAG: hypothetical protein PHD13_01360 [Methanocellales archaeon]|nr:hypothetical protein [Methanocellales archaeon]MDD3290926.1 hypothetical protein [Methanocellales archaeon]MDD3292330.1 hypothetical protein [Methanocellales archaeon]MDD5234811.1 hypothetical protein [Methanocellales archaeon]MDD5484819.1 hypothetical protein [Methanocellales archaeon]
MTEEKKSVKKYNPDQTIRIRNKKPEKQHIQKIKPDKSSDGKK